VQHSAWTSYSINRLQTNQKYRTVVSVPSKGSEDGPEADKYDECSGEAWLFDNAKTCVSQIEEEMNLEHGILQKCITIIHNEMLLDADEDSDVRKTY
jgi:hypothetical protein